MAMKAGRMTVAPPLPLRPCPELPQEMLMEIFVRLPPKDFIRCGSVCRSWRVVTSDRSVQLLHHLRQPRQYHVINFVRQEGFLDLGVADFSLETLDVQADEIRTIVRFVDKLTPEAAELGTPFVLHGSCQGVLLISHYEELFLCNPTTRCWARLHPIHTDSTMVGLYLHPELEEFRILYRRDDAVKGTCSYYVFEIESRVIRMISEQELTFQLDPAPVCLTDRLYWFRVPILPGELSFFDTVAEVFDSMPVPPFDEENQRMLRYQLVDLEGQLAITIAWCEQAQEDLEGPCAVDLWVWEKDTTWVLKCRVQLPVPDILHFVADNICWTAGLVSLDGDVIVTTESRIIHYDRHGSSKLAVYNEGDFLELSPFVLKESVVPYPHMRLTNPPILELPFFRWL